MKLGKRNDALFAFYCRGWSHQRIAERYGLSTARINQIIMAMKLENPRYKKAA
jgi:DNA-binding transcriptional regulator LsrR (DeoR family)